MGRLWRRGWWVWVAAATVWAPSCGLDVTFDEEARGAIGRYEPAGAADAGAAEVDADEERAPLEGALSHAGWGAVLGRWLQGGCVDYAGLGGSAESRGLLALYLDQLRRVDLEAPLPAEERRALWINAYNASAVAGVVQELEVNPGFRVDQSGFSFFSERRFVVGGLVLSLDQMEHGALRGQADHPSLAGLDAETKAALGRESAAMGGLDPRIHFAVNCASRSCPDLLAEPYRGEALDEQLEAQTRRFLGDATKGAGPEGISMLFTWFEGDFTGGGSVASFIEAHRAGGLDGVLLGEALPYDWALNGVAAGQPQCEE